MNFNEYYVSTRSMLMEKKPSLLRAFEDLVATVSTLTPLTVDLGEAINRLTLASEYQYLSPAFVQLALSRGELSVLASLLYALAGSRTASALISSYPRCNFNIAPLEQGILSLERRGRESGITVHAVLPYILSRNDGAFARRYLEAFDGILEASPQAMMEVFNLMNSRLRRIRPVLMEAWLFRGVDLITSGRVEEGVSFLRLRSSESRQMLGIKSVVLGDIQRSLRIYAASLAGRNMAIQSLEISPVKLKMPYCDGKSLYLPESVSLYRAVTENERVYSVLAALQSASISMGSFSLSHDMIDFLNDIRDRYATVLPDIMDNVRRQYGAQARTIRERPTGEVDIIYQSGRTITVLETPLEKFFYLFPAPDLARELFRMAENKRIRHALSRRYPGLAEDFRLLDKALPRLWEPAAAAKARREDQFHLLLAGILEMSVKDALLSGLTGGLQNTALQVREALSIVEGPGATVVSSARACFLMFNQLYDLYPVITYCQRRDIRETVGAELLLGYAPEVVLDVSPEMIPEAPQGRLHMDSRQEGAAIDLSSLQVRGEKGRDLQSLILSGDVDIYRYPEYSEPRGEYIKNHCTLFERILPRGDDRLVKGIYHQHEKLHKRLKKRFLLMQPEELEITRRWEDGEEIHMGDAFDYLTEFVRGESHDQKIFTRRLKNVRDIAVALLIDASSSTNREVNGKSIMDIEKESVALLASALTGIGDVFGIFSFFSRGRREVNYQVIKDFHEPWSTQVQSRLSSVKASDSNRDGCAIRHSAARLNDRREKTRLLLMLSDGIPADPGYGGRDGVDTSRYAIEDTRRALSDCRQRGIKTFCLTIDTDARDYVPHLYGEYNYSILDDVEQLPERLSRLYWRITR